MVFKEMHENHLRRKDISFHGYDTSKDNCDHRTHGVSNSTNNRDAIRKYILIETQNQN